jgi:hypothetical protein
MFSKFGLFNKDGKELNEFLNLNKKVKSTNLFGSVGKFVKDSKRSFSVQTFEAAQNATKRFALFYGLGFFATVMLISYKNGERRVDQFNEEKKHTDNVVFRSVYTDLRTCITSEKDARFYGCVEKPFIKLAYGVIWPFYIASYMTQFIGSATKSKK